MGHPIRKSLIPVAELETRMLLAKKAITKKLLPVDDGPVIEHLAKGAIESDITEIILVTTRGKEAIENHFDAGYEFEHRPEKKGKETMQLTRENNKIKIEEVQGIAEILKNFEGAGGLLVDFEVSLSGDSWANIVPEDLDTSEIPEQISTVTAVGEVRRTGTHTFQAGLDLNDYLGLSAGLTARAENEELYTVRAHGPALRPTTERLRFEGGNDSINTEGSIVVSKYAGLTDNLTLRCKVTQVAFSSVSGLASMILVAR